MAKASNYKFTAAATKKLEGMGYVLYGIDKKDFPSFMQKHYPRFNLLAWLKAVEKLIVHLAMTSVERGIEVKGDGLRVRFHNAFTNEDDALIFDRQFYRDAAGMKVSHEYFVLPVSARGKDLSKRVLKVSLVHYQKMKADFIEVIAGLSKGAYVWALYGFVATDRTDMDRILRKVKPKLTIDQYNFLVDIYTDYYGTNPSGEAFPIKNWADLPFMKKLLMDPGCEWKGRLDLNNPDHLRKFEEYVSRQKK